MERATLFTILGIAVAAVVIAGVGTFVILGNGDDEATAKGRCQGAAYELSAERDSDDNRMQASLEVKANASQEQWDVRITSNDRQVLQRTVASDDEAELDADAFLGTGEKPQNVVAFFGRAGTQPCTAQLELG